MNIRAAIRAFVSFAVVAALAVSLHAQAGSTISVSVRDGKSGLPVRASNFLVKIDRNDTIHNEWVRINKDGTVTVTVPASAKEIAIKATYDISMETYVNCDIARESDRDRDIWYSVSLILKSGVVAPNECSRTDYTAKPGEFIFFVRKRGWRDADNF